MKNSIITPTYEEHFKYIGNYLKSVERYLIDKDKTTIYFIINRAEEQQFMEIISKTQNLNLEIIFFEDLLKKYNIDYTPNELLEKYGKFSYQSLKKLYAMLSIDSDWFLMIDSESMFVEETSLSDLLKEYKNKPYLTFSKLMSRKITHPFLYNVVHNIDRLMNKNNNVWFLETFNWFIDKSILQDIIREYGSPFEIVNKLFINANQEKEKSHLFEGLLYYQYIYLNNEKYHYNLIDIDKELEKYLSNKNLKKYLSNFYLKFNGHAGIIEYALSLLDNNNTEELAMLFKENNFNIIRCEETTSKNYLLQKKFMDILTPNLLVVSQNHAFGINNNIYKKIDLICKISKNIKRLKININYLLRPVASIFKYISKCIELIYNIIKIPTDILLNIYKITKLR